MVIKYITCNSLIATHELAGNACRLGTRNCKHPDQCPMSNIMQIKLKILINTLAMFKNYNNVTLSDYINQHNNEYIFI